MMDQRDAKPDQVSVLGLHPSVNWTVPHITSGLRYLAASVLHLLSSLCKPATTRINRQNNAKDFFIIMFLFNK
jgi:hypothetical protein